MIKRVPVVLGDQSFVVSLDQGKGTAVVRERILIFEGKRRKFYDEKICWVHDPKVPAAVPNQLYERVIELARSAP